MSLLDRTIAAEKCLVRGCQRKRAPEAQVCEADLELLWRNQLDRLADGSFIGRRQFLARDTTMRGAA